jgi:hypothetical protein
MYERNVSRCLQRLIPPGRNDCHGAGEEQDIEKEFPLPRLGDLELESSDDGYLTDNYNCIICGEPILHQHQ